LHVIPAQIGVTVNLNEQPCPEISGSSIMQANKLKWIVIFMIIKLDGCIDPFYPQIIDNQQSLVIEGLITNQEGYHYIRISRSAPYDNPKNIPEQNCQVEVIDKKGNGIQFYESEPGLYEQWIEQEYLKTGNQYKLNVITTNGKYESRYETLLPCPPIENVYYEIVTKETSDSRFPIYGIQFYTDLYAPGENAKYYRWELIETWEYHAEYMIRFYYDGELHDLGYYSDSLYYCWLTKPVQEIYTATIQHVSGDSLYKIPLGFVSNETDRLKIKYSLLVKQYSLNDTAYQYWNQVKKQNQETGGLYEIQPTQLKGNIYNLNNEDEVVLGYFNVSSLSEKRIMIDESFQFFQPVSECQLEDIRRLDWLPVAKLPVNLVSVSRTSRGPWQTAQKHCFDCTVLGGTTKKPDFWE